MMLMTLNDIIEEAITAVDKTLKVKRLSLHWYMTLVETHDWSTISQGLRMVPVIYNRDGWYCRGTDCWWEYNGCAYTSTGLLSSFKWDLDHLLAHPLSSSEADQLKKTLGFVPKPLKRELLKLLSLHYHNQEIRSIGRQTRLHFIKHRSKK